MALGLFALVAVILYVGRSAIATTSHLRRRSKKLFILYCVTFAVFILFSLYELILGSRSLIWFGLYGIVACASLYFSNSSAALQRRSSLIIILFLVVLLSVTPKIQNRGIIYGPDEWRDVKVTTYVVENGTFMDAPYFKGDYYSALPLFNILNAMVSSLSGWNVMLIFSLMPPILTIASSLVTYAVMYRLSKSHMLASLFVILSSSMPRSSSGQYIPAVLSGSLGSLLVLLLILVCLKKDRRFLVLASITAFTVSLVHPLGVMPLLLLSVGILALVGFFFRKSLPTSTISATRGFFLACLVIGIAAWSSQAILLNGVTAPVEKFIETLVSFGRIRTSYSLQYQSQGLELYAYPWAVPVSVSAAFLLLSLKDLLKRNPRRKGLDYVFFLASAAVGLILVLLGFASVVSNPGAAVERYVNGTAYGLLSFSTALVFFVMFRGRKIFAVLAIALLFANIVIGTNSPDNAPFEHESFGAFRTTWISTIEAHDIIVFLNSTTRVYGDHDIPVSSLMSQIGLQNQTYVGFQPIRAVLETFKNNSFTPFDPQYASSVFIIKTDEIINHGLFSNYVNTLYNSERHVMIANPQP